MKRKLTILVMALAAALTSAARDFTYTYQGQSVVYTVIDESAKTVKTKDGNYADGANKVTGALVLPAHPKEGSTTYTLTEIGEYSFYKATGMTSVTIPSTVTTLNDNAFRTCSALNSVTIPNSVTLIGNTAFGACSSLTTITVPSSVKTIGSYAFSTCTSLTTVNIPSSVTSIGDGVFKACAKLTAIEIPASVANIGANVFMDCTNLQTVKILGPVKTLGYKMFQNCSSLTAFEIPATVTSIGDIAFYGCTSLTSITIPGSVTSIGPRAFGGCNGFDTFTIESAKVTPSKLMFASTGETAPTKTAMPKQMIVPAIMYSAYVTEFADYSDTEIITQDIVFTYDNDQFDIARNQTKTLTLNLPGAEELIDFQTDVVLPTGLSIASNAGKLDVTLGSGKKASHVVMAAKVSGANTYRIVVYSSKNETFTSGNGILNISIQSDNNLLGGDIKLCNALLSLTNNKSQTPPELTIPVPAFVGVESIDVTPAEASLNFGKTLQLTAEVSPSTAWEKKVTWSSSNTAVATVDENGLVTPVAKGTVTITAKATDGTNVTGTATINVTNYAQTLSLGQESLSIEEDETLQLNPVLTPANAEELGLS